MFRKPCVIVLLAAVVAVGGCDMLDPARPTVQPDTEIFGNVMDSEELPDEPGVYTVRVTINPPRALEQAEAAGGRPTPPVEDGIVAELRVDSDTVVLRRGMPATLNDFTPGTEVVGLPVPGTTRMSGETLILLNADMLMDFETFRNWRLPLLPGENLPPVDDPSKVNTDGMERAAVPLNGGKVLYFSARLRRVPEGNSWTYAGALRDGLQPAEDTNLAPEMPFRTEWSEDGWSAPELVQFPDTEGASLVRVTWANPEETVCLVTVKDAPDGVPRVGRSERRSAKSGWGQIQPLEGIGEGYASDAVYLGGDQAETLLFCAARGGANQTDLYLFNATQQETALPLEPRINTVGSEWGPRIGPDNALYFSRADRQLVFTGGMVQPVYLGLEHRVFFSEVAVTDDGVWVFLTYTIPSAGDPDLDIWVAPRSEDGAIGLPVPIAEWHP